MNIMSMAVAATMCVSSLMAADVNQLKGLPRGVQNIKYENGAISTFVVVGKAAVPDALRKKPGLARYLNVGTNDQLSISGLYSAAVVKKDGGKLRYSFAVPVAGCQVEVGAAKPKRRRSRWRRTQSLWRRRRSQSLQPLCQIRIPQRRRRRRKYPLAREAATMIYYTPLNASS